MKQLKDFITMKENIRNRQISFDLKKRELKKNNIDVEDLLKISIKKINKKSK